MGRGGGVLIYIRDSLNAKEISPTADLSIECLCINVTLSQNMQFNIMAVYNPPSVCTAMLCKNLDALFKDYNRNREVLVF